MAFCNGVVSTKWFTWEVSRSFISKIFFSLFFSLSRLSVLFILILKGEPSLCLILAAWFVVDNLY